MDTKTSTPCPVCADERWLCELYLERPWENVDGCGCAGRCPACNPLGDVGWRKVYAEVPRDPDEPVQ